MKLFGLALPALLGLSMAMPNPNPNIVIETTIYDSELASHIVVHDDKSRALYLK